MALNPKTQKRSNAIIRKLQEFMDIRFLHAVRANPGIKDVYEDIRWQQLMTIRLILEHTKSWGPERYYVADVLCDDNVSRKRSIFNPTDQNSILNEIINLKEESKKGKRAGQLPIMDMRTFYSALNPNLERVVELIQTWIWWDLADVSDMVAFESQAQMLKKVLTIKIEGPILDHYVKIMKMADSEIGKKIVAEFEFKRLVALEKTYEDRREFDFGYNMIIKRDVKEDKTVGPPYDYKQYQLKRMKGFVEHFKKAVEAIK
jgi:hypothetical protein